MIRDIKTIKNYPMADHRYRTYVGYDSHAEFGKYFYTGRALNGNSCAGIGHTLKQAEDAYKKELEAEKE